MGDSFRKDAAAVNSTNKSRRSRNELIRMALGVYLKQRNYVAAEKYRKSDFCLSQTPQEFVLKKMIDEDTCHPNAILTSNVICLKNNYAAIEQHFSKFVQFIQNQKELIKNELSNLIGPMMCHLYLELLKGREWKLASNFLRNYAHHIGPIENLNAPLPNKVNGCSINSNSHDESSSFPTATTQILFCSGTTGNPNRDYFRDLIQSLSLCVRVDMCDAHEIIVIFRSSKYELQVGIESINALKHYLSRHGHTIIMNILQTWIYFDITDIKADDGKNLFNLQDFFEDKSDILTNGNEIKQEFKTEDIVIDVDEMYRDDDSRVPKRSNVHLRQLKHSVLRLQKVDTPIRTIKINDPRQSLVCGAMDSTECHTVAGFNNSIIKLWQLNKKTSRGRSLYKKFRENLCDWDVNRSTDEDLCSDNEQSTKSNPLRSSLHSTKRIGTEYLENKCEENSFDDSGGVTLRGHSKGITDVIFSVHHPLMFSVSKDLTMRAWKATDYSCGAIYRGHNYPIWCVSESPIANYMATGSRDYTARLWSADRQFPLITYVGHTQDVECVAFHPNGNYIATGSCDLSVRLWSTTDGKVLRVFPECRYPITCIAFSPDGKLLAAAGEETKIRIFDLAAGSQVAELKDHSANVSDIAWNATGSKFASCCADGSIRVWDVSKIGAGDQSSQSSSSVVSNKVLWHMSGCSRSVKIMFHSTESVTSIGGS